MSQDRHLVYRQKFEVDFSSREHYEELSARLSEFARKQMVQIMEEVFSSIATEHLHIRLNVLDIDLGEVAFDLMESEMAEKLKTALLEALQKQIRQIETSPSPGVGAIVSRSYSDLELLAFYLQHGALPWWANSNPDFSLTELLEKVIRQQPAALVQLLRRIGRQVQVRKRMAKQFDEERLHALIAVLAPAQAAFIRAYVAEIQTAQKQQQVVAAPEADFKAVVWELVLTHLLSDRGSAFNRKAFVKWHIEKTAAHYRLSYPELLDALVAAIPGRAANGIETPAGLLATLKSEAQNNQQRTHFLPQTTAQLLQHAGRFLSGKSRAKQTDRLHWQYALANHPSEVRRLVKQVGRKAVHRKAMVNELPERQLIRLIGILAPGEAAFITAYSRDISLLQQRNNVIKTDPETFRKAKWEFIFSYLLEESGSVFNKKAFLKSQVLAMSRRFNVAYHTLLELLVQAVKEVQIALQLRGTLPLLLTELQREYAHEQQRRTGPERADQQVILNESHYEALICFLKYGIFPPALLAKGMIGQVSAPWQLMEQWLAKHPGKVKRLWKELGDHPNALKRMVIQFSADVLQKMLLLLPVDIEIPREVIAALQRRSDVQTGEFALFLKLETARYFLLHGVSASGADPLQVIGELLRYHPAKIRQLLAGVVASPQALAGLSRLPQEVLLRLIAFFPGYITAEQWKTLVEGSDDAEVIVGLLKKISAATSSEAWKSLIEGGVDETLLAGLLQQTVSGTDSSKISAQLWKALLEKVRNPRAVLTELLRKDRTLLTRCLTWFFRTGSLPADFGISEEEFVVLLTETFGNEAKRYLSGKWLPRRLLSRWLSGKIPVEALQLPDFWITQAVEQDAAGVAQQLSLKPAHIRRVVKTLSEATLMRLLYAVQPVQFRALMEQSEMLMEMLEKSEMASKKVFDRRQFRWEFLFFYLSQRTSGALDMVHLLRAFITFTASHFSQSRRDTAKVLLIQIRQEKETEQAQKLQQSAEVIEKQLIAATINKPVRMQEKKPRKVEQPPAPEPIFIRNAGLVLLHPFLPRLFNMAGLTEAGKFKDATAADYAVHLLQYLVDEGKNSGEHELVLNKLICGIPLSEPVSREMELLEKDKNFCEGLLKGAIQNWTIIKNSSVTNFRVSFLQREGRLLNNGESWSLKVEQRGYDVLMDKLPWGIGTVKMAWMEKPVFVEGR